MSTMTCIILVFLSLVATLCVWALWRGKKLDQRGRNDSDWPRFFLIIGLLQLQVGCSVAYTSTKNEAGSGHQAGYGQLLSHDRGIHITPDGSINIDEANGAEFGAVVGRFAGSALAAGVAARGINALSDAHKQTQAANVATQAVKSTEKVKTTAILNPPASP